MNFDELKKCTRCESDACYSQEINKDITIELCYGCGFQSNSIMTSGSQFLSEQMEILPELYKELIDQEEESGKIWIPTTINIKDKGIVFADGSGRFNWNWAGVKAIKVKKKDKEKYNGAKYRADMSTIKHFAEKDFMEALSYIGLLPE